MLDVVSVKLYYADAYGNKQGEVPATEWSYSTSEDYTVDNHTKDLMTLTASVPDGVSLVLVYVYKLSSYATTPNEKLGDLRYSMDNTCDLYAGSSEEGEDTTTKTEVEKTESSTADGSGVRFFKVSENQNTVVLDGAVFGLYKWNGSDWEKVAQGTSDASKDGEILLKDLSTGAGYSYDLDVAYKLVEEEAPAGYDKAADYYFWLKGTGTVSAPSGWDGK